MSVPIGLHPENPRYFLYKGRPLALITATEHYGAVSTGTSITSRIWTTFPGGGEVHGRAAGPFRR